MSYQRKRAVWVNDAGHVIGEDHHRSRLSDHEIDLLVGLRADGMPLREIADKFEISVKRVSEYATGKRRNQMATGQKLVAHTERRFRPARPRDFDIDID